jgi:hypothetical protein
MTTHALLALAGGASGLRAGGMALAVALLAVLPMPQALAQAPAAATNPAAGLSDAELETLVGRIALYPDDLIAIILPASTNPLQIVQADRFLAKRKTDPKAPVDENWDDAVKSLLNYPEVVTAMSSDLDWTAALGEAVVTDQGDVLGAIQAFRRKTQAAGTLNSDQKQVVVVEKEIIKIVPADPQVIYVPQYNPSTVVVYGSPSWGYYPSPYPVYYYPYAPGAAFAAGLIWGAAISSAWRGNHYAAHYGGNANININRNVNINTGNVNTGNVNRPAAGNTSAWTPNKQPGQVSRSVGATPPARVGDARPAGVSTTARPSAQPSAQTSAAGRAAPSRSDFAGPSATTAAFDGYGSGRQAGMDSSHGAASRGFADRPQREFGGRR